MKHSTILVFVVFLALIFGSWGCNKNSPTTPTTKNPPVISSFSISPAAINRGASATLSWSVTNATTVSIDQGVGSVPTSGSRSVSPEKDTVYTLTASNNDGSTSKTCEIKVTQPAKPGTWTSTTAFGVFEFTVNSQSTYITSFKRTFSNWRGRSGSILTSREPGWAITDRKFNISTVTFGETWSFSGTFTESGDKASGTWSVVFPNLGGSESGSWQASPK